MLSLNIRFQGRTFSANVSLESKLRKWEFMKAQGILRAQLDSKLFAGRRKGVEGVRSTMVLRGGARGPGAVTAGAAVRRHSAVDADSMLDEMNHIFGPESEFIEEKFHVLNNQCSKVIGFEDRLDKICAIMKRLASSVSKISHNQLQVTFIWTPLFSLSPQTQGCAVSQLSLRKVLTRSSKFIIFASEMLAHQSSELCANSTI